MAIRKENKFDSAVAELNLREAAEDQKTGKVIRNMTTYRLLVDVVPWLIGLTFIWFMFRNMSGGKTRTVIDKNGRERTVRVAEKRKTLPVYIPESLFEQFNAITSIYGKSNNAAIVELIREYVAEEKDVLNDK